MDTIIIMSLLHKLVGNINCRTPLTGVERQNKLRGFFVSPRQWAACIIFRQPSQVVPSALLVVYYSRVVCILREYSKYDRSTLTVMPEYIVPCLYSYSLVLQLVVTTLRARISNILHTLIECILCVL